MQMNVNEYAYRLFVHCIKLNVECNKEVRREEAGDILLASVRCGAFVGIAFRLNNPMAYLHISRPDQKRSKRREREEKTQRNARHSLRSRSKSVRYIKDHVF